MKTSLSRNSLICLLSIMLLNFPSMAWADEYVLVMNKEDNVCQHMLKLYNADLRQYGQVKYEQHNEFNWIKWEDKGIQLRPAGAPEEIDDIDVKIVFFDINNDSKEEAIIFSQSMLSNKPTNNYEIFRHKDIKMFEDVVDGSIFNSKILVRLSSADGIPINVYEISKDGFNKLPKRARDSIKWITKSSENKNNYFIGYSQKINFIKLNDHFYINFEGPRDVGPKEDYNKVEHYNIISELQQNNTLKHQCLFLINKNNKNNRRKN